MVVERYLDGSMKVKGSKEDKKIYNFMNDLIASLLDSLDDKKSLILFGIKINETIGVPNIYKDNVSDKNYYYQAIYKSLGDFVSILGGDIVEKNILELDDGFDYVRGSYSNENITIYSNGFFELTERGEGCGNITRASSFYKGLSFYFLYMKKLLKNPKKTLKHIDSNLILLFALFVQIPFNNFKERYQNLSEKYFNDIDKVYKELSELFFVSILDVKIYVRELENLGISLNR